MLGQIPLPIEKCFKTVEKNVSQDVSRCGVWTLTDFYKIVFFYFRFTGNRRLANILNFIFKAVFSLIKTRKFAEILENVKNTLTCGQEVSLNKLCGAGRKEKEMHNTL